MFLNLSYEQLLTFRPSPRPSRIGGLFGSEPEMMIGASGNP